MSAADTTLARAREARINAQICAAVRERRVDMGVLQAQLATHVGLADSTFSRYESGQRTISVAMLCMIADYLRQPITAFLPSNLNLPTPPPSAGTPPAPLQQITALLERRPDLVPTVLGLLESLLEASHATE